MDLVSPEHCCLPSPHRRPIWIAELFHASHSKWVIEVEIIVVVALCAFTRLCFAFSSRFAMAQSGKWKSYRINVDGMWLSVCRKEMIVAMDARSKMCVLLKVEHRELLWAHTTWQCRLLKNDCSRGRHSCPSSIVFLEKGILCQREWIDLLGLVAIIFGGKDWARHH